MSETRTGRWFYVAAAMFAVAYGGNEFTPLLVFYEGEFNFSSIQANAALGAYAIGIIPALLIAGPLSDRFGRRPIMLQAVPISFLGSFVLAIGASSTAMLIIGRVLSGIALGISMAVGTTWVKELADEYGAPPGAGARRAAMTLTTGFLIGAFAASMLAQWGPIPEYLPYIVHALVCAATVVLPSKVPETHPEGPGSDEQGLLQDLVVPELARWRFNTVIMPTAPWVFTCATVAFGILPSLMAQKAGHMPIAFAGIITAITLSCATAIQMLGTSLDSPRSARASIIALTATTIGMGLAVAASASLSFPLVFIAATALGAGQGMALLGGLSEVQRLAGARNLAGLTSIFYSLAYLGFFTPFILSWFNRWLSYPQMFTGLTILAALCTALVAFSSSKDLPGPEAA